MCVCVCVCVNTVLSLKQRITKSFLVFEKCFKFYNYTNKLPACGVMVIVVGNGHGDTSSNPGRD